VTTMPTETGAETIRVLLVDDHQVVRQGLAQLLGDGVGISVVGQAGTGEAALALAQSTPADVMVLDYSLPDVNGAKVASQLRRDGSALRVVILTVHDNVHYVLRAMDAGADAFVVKSDSVEELLRAIRRVHVGGSYVSPRLAEKVEHHQRGPKGHHVGLDKLSQHGLDLPRTVDEQARDDEHRAGDQVRAGERHHELRVGRALRGGAGALRPPTRQQPSGAPWTRVTGRGCLAEGGWRGRHSLPSAPDWRERAGCAPTAPPLRARQRPARTAVPV